MKRIRLLAVLAALTLLAAACGDGDTGDTTATTTAPETTAAGGLADLGGRAVTVAVENAYTPFNYYDDAGNAVGWDYDAVGEICARVNCVPEFKEVGWDGMILAVSQSQFDMAADGITITDERKEVVDFSDGYIDLEIRLMTLVDESRFTTLDEFKNGAFVVGTQVATTNYDKAVEEYGADRIIAFDQFPLAVQALIAGDVDAVIIDDTAGVGYVGESADQTKLLEGSLQSDQLGFIFPKGSDLLAPFNAAIAAMKADGRLQEINDQWFS
ncbi:MAG TPA: ABC transporter substrate-binding protein [Acidimicrobiia bacterium]|nr:ABC transporter substrate-binding protein [Acidimicrobiia bacterium]